MSSFGKIIIGLAVWSITLWWVFTVKYDSNSPTSGVVIFTAVVCSVLLMLVVCRIVLTGANNTQDREPRSKGGSQCL